MAALDIGRAPYNCGKLPHDVWRDILPFTIDMYENHSIPSICWNQAFGEAGKARKGISSSDIAKLGDKFAENDRKVQAVINACIR